MEDFNDYDFNEEFDDCYEYDEDNKYAPISPETYMQALILLDRSTLRDKLSVISFYIASFECFKAKVIEDIQSIFCVPEVTSTLEKIEFKKSTEYKKNILDRVVGKGKTGWDDRLKATMLWLLNNKAINKADYEIFIKLRDLRNSYVHEMATYIIDTGKITMENYESLKTLIQLFKKIEIWFIKNIEIPRSYSEELLDGEIEDKDISSPLISILELMAESLDLM